MSSGTFPTTTDRKTYSVCSNGKKLMPGRNSLLPRKEDENLPISALLMLVVDEIIYNNVIARTRTIFIKICP